MIISVLEDFQKEKEAFVMPEKKPLFGKRKQPVSDDPYWKRLRQKVESCYICDKIDYNMERYYHTFCVLAKEPEFRAKVENSKGFCLRHFGELLAAAEQAGSHVEAGVIVSGDAFIADPVKKEGRERRKSRAPGSVQRKQVEAREDPQ